MTINPTLVYERELPRSDYMMSGILVFLSLFFALFTGGILGSEEKDQITMIEIQMREDGIIYSLIGKLITTILLSSVLMSFIILFNGLFYGFVFPDFFSILVFCVVFMCLSFIFSLIGVVYGLRAGDFR